MSLSELNQKLIAAARATPPDERMPYAFEQRIMAHLAGKTALDSLGLWGRSLSRAAALCAGLMVLLALASFYAPANNSDSLSQEVETTLFAAVDNNVDQAGDAR
jgi:hypothetical protein